MNIRFVLNILGRVLIILGLFMCTNFIWVGVYEEATFWGHFYACIITLLGGAGLFLGTSINLKPSLGLRESYLTVTFAWVVISAFSTLPYLFTQSIATFEDAFFESVSGLTTTGASILNDIEALPRSVLYWRSMTHWIGGMGIIVLVVAILPMLRVGGYNLFKSEATGISYEKLTPRTASTAKRLWGIYLGLTFLQVVFLMFGNMDFFESLCHSFGTIATGGFSTQNDSIAGYSPYIQYVITVFMLLAGVNFTLHYFLIKGKFKKLRRNDELRTYLGIILVAGVVITVILVRHLNLGVEEAFRKAFFQVVSIITSTGFITDDYLLWPTRGWFVIFLLFFVGASVGSTGGGIKVIRLVVAFKSFYVNFLRLLHPNSVIVLRVNGEVVDDEKVSTILGFIVLYFVTAFVGTVVMIFMNVDAITAMASVISSMGAIGPAFGEVGPTSNFAMIPDGGKFFLSFLMILGRLELTTVFVLFTLDFWKD
ncbi:TrkH family potassium uptake protein [Marinilabilia salmonicolor]|jgi:trk system potassium uptake protein TrkH|uniref:Trk system potassium uptake protein TrkH n=1 Tax=Marinilabilia salmonicolor TaxID=989 RepID=A0A2T0XPZ0_9BACT|nr:TrkH family potassium uptake protein [Marinilabilia salmonicolor]PRZ01001.1 trk system potassium uptake protein TrkH [Marinilabilia salmonicolor]RCW31118.1 trk system potassium uptake protein TrkH [Marinilabilia salmonicolor]